MGTLDAPPTARYTGTPGEFELLEEGPPTPRLEAYFLEGESVKGLTMGILIPRGLLEDCRELGIDHVNVARAGAILAVRRAVKAAKAGGAVDRTGNTALAADCRIALGLAIQARRKELKLSRAQLHSSLRNLIPPGKVRGWGQAQVQQWENGRSAPREVWPLLKALRVGGDEALKWIDWWGTARRGVVPEREAEAGGENVPGSAVERLQRTLAEAKEKLGQPDD